MRLNDQELIDTLQGLVKEERGLLGVVLRHLRDVEERQLFLARGFSSMFAFCTSVLGYSEAEAHLRIQAMRLVRAVPEVEKKIEAGELSLSTAGKAQSAFRRHACGAEKKREVLAELSGLSTRATERKLAEIFPEQPKREVERAISEELTRIAFTATKEQLAKFQRLKELLAHKNFEGRFDLLFEELADQALEKLDAPVLRARQVHEEKRTRYIPKATRKALRKKAEGQCQYIDPETGHRCQTRHGLQVDHILEFSKGGSRSPDNLQLLCGAHNRWRSARRFERGREARCVSKVPG